MNMDTKSLRAWCNLSGAYVRLLTKLGDPRFWNRYDEEALDWIEDAIDLLKVKALDDHGDPSIARLALKAFLDPVRSLRRSIDRTDLDEWLIELFELALAMNEAAVALESDEEPLEAGIRLGRVDAGAAFAARESRLRDGARQMLESRKLAAAVRAATLAARAPSDTSAA